MKMTRRQRRDFADALMTETYGLKPKESAFFIGALASNLSHNLPADMADKVIAAFKESRVTARKCFSDYSSIKQFLPGD